MCGVGKPLAADAGRREAGERLGGVGRAVSPRFLLRLVIVLPSLLSVTSNWGFIFLFMNLGNLFVFQKKQKKKN